MYTEYQQEKICAFLFETGHANPRFVGKRVVYRDQTRGQHAMDKILDPQPILDIVEHMSLLDIERLVKRAAFAQVGVTYSTFALYNIDNSGNPEPENWSNNLTVLLQKLNEPDPFAVFGALLND